MPLHTHSRCPLIDLMSVFLQVCQCVGVLWSVSGCVWPRRRPLPHSIHVWIGGNSCKVAGVFLAVGGGACLLTLTVPAGDQSNMARGTFLEIMFLFNNFLIKICFFSQTVLMFRLLWPWWGNLELQHLLPSSIFILQNYSQLFSGTHTQNLLKSHDL